MSSIASQMLRDLDVLELKIVNLIHDYEPTAKSPGCPQALIEAEIEDKEHRPYLERLTFLLQEKVVEAQTTPSGTPRAREFRLTMLGEELYKEYKMGKRKPRPEPRLAGDTELDNAKVPRLGKPRASDPGDGGVNHATGRGESHGAKSVMGKAKAGGQ